MIRTPARVLVRAVVLALAATLLSLVGPAVAPASGVAPDETSAKKRFFVRWDTPAIFPGTKIRAHGKVPGGKRRVLLQVKVKNSWRTIRTKQSKKSGKFQITARLDWYGYHKVRVTTPGRRGLTRVKRIAVVTPYVPAGSPRDYKYFHGRTVRQNYRFNPCQTIRYRINSEDVGDGGAALVKAAILQASWATGIKFKYVGKSKVIPYNYRKPYGGNTDMVIGWATNAEVPDFVRRNAAGFGGPTWIYPARDYRGRRTYVSTDAGVTLSTDYWRDFAPSFFDNTRAAGGQLILHEIGHALGLDHTKAYEQMMNGETYYRSPDGYYKGLYNAGDLKGFTKVGLGQGCLRKVRGRVAATQVPLEPLP